MIPDAPSSSSGITPHFDPDFHNVDIAIRSHPGVLYPANLEQETRTYIEIQDIAQPHISSPVSAHEVVEPIYASLRKQFPKARRVSLTFKLDVNNKFKQQGLKKAEIRTGYRGGQAGPSLDEVATCWLLPIDADGKAGFNLSTVEHTQPSLHEDHEVQLEAADDRKRDPSDRQFTTLGQAHPAFYVHQEVIKSQRGDATFGESTTLRLAKLAFEIADKQYGDKRLQEVSVGTRTIHGLHDHASQHTLSLDRDQYERSRRSMLNGHLQPGWHRAYLALGSNIGDRITMIESACTEMRSRGLVVMRTSALYETKAMYLEDQQPFVNGACKVCRPPVTHQCKSILI